MLTPVRGVYTLAECRSRCLGCLHTDFAVWVLVYFRRVGKTDADMASAIPGRLCNDQLESRILQIVLDEPSSESSSLLAAFAQV